MRRIDRNGWLAVFGLSFASLACAAPQSQPAAACTAACCTTQCGDGAHGWSSERPQRGAMGDVVVDGVAYDAHGKARTLASETVAAPPPYAGQRLRSLGVVAPPAPRRPKRVGRRDIAVRNASLDNALRAIADAGRFNLVTQGALGATVSVRLRAVEPYDALLALAEAHDLDVRFRDGIVIARAAR